MQNWYPTPSDDESVGAQNINNEAHFFVNNKLKIASELLLQNRKCVLSLGLQSHRDCLYSRCRSISSIGKFYLPFPHVNGPQVVLANSHFSKPGMVVMLWNEKPLLCYNSQNGHG
jgi:hypothetical protein